MSLDASLILRIIFSSSACVVRSTSPVVRRREVGIVAVAVLSGLTSPLVSLARAVYSRASTLFLDDVLSAGMY